MKTLLAPVAVSSILIGTVLVISAAYWGARLFTRSEVSGFPGAQVQGGITVGLAGLLGLCGLILGLILWHRVAGPHPSARVFIPVTLLCLLPVSAAFASVHYLLDRVVKHFV